MPNCCLKLYTKKESKMNKLNVVCGQALVDRYPREKFQLATKNAAWIKCETKEEALIREWKEECDIDIYNVQYLASSVDYQDGYEIHLTCFTCTSNEKPTKLSVHSEYIWTTPNHIYDYNFFKSDKMLVEALKGVWPCLTKPMKPKY